MEANNMLQEQEQSMGETESHYVCVKSEPEDCRAIDSYTTKPESTEESSESSHFCFFCSTPISNPSWPLRLKTKKSRIGRTLCSLLKVDPSECSALFYQGCSYCILCFQYIEELDKLFVRTQQFQKRINLKLRKVENLIDTYWTKDTIKSSPGKRKILSERRKSSRGTGGVINFSFDEIKHIIRDPYVPIQRVENVNHLETDPMFNTTVSDNESNLSELSPKPKRGRGRPRKSTLSSVRQIVSIEKKRKRSMNQNSKNQSSTLPPSEKLLRRTAAVSSKFQKLISEESILSNDENEEHEIKKKRHTAKDRNWSSDSEFDEQAEAQNLSDDRPKRRKESRNRLPLKKYNCSECDKHFNQKNLRDEHEAVVHCKTADGKPLIIKCDQCDRTFQSSTRLKSHRIKEHEKRFQCKECGKCMESRYLLDHHIGIVHEPGTFLCQMCGKSFYTGQSLNRHVRHVHTNKSLKCDICHMEIKTRSAFKKHRDSHLGKKKKSMCSICGRVFASTTMKRHMLIHTGERAFKCELCGKDFMTKDYLKIHLKYHQRAQERGKTTLQHFESKSVDGILITKSGAFKRTNRYLGKRKTLAQVGLASNTVDLACTNPEETAVEQTPASTTTSDSLKNHNHLPRVTDTEIIGKSLELLHATTAPVPVTIPASSVSVSAANLNATIVSDEDSAAVISLSSNSVFPSAPIHSVGLGTVDHRTLWGAQQMPEGVRDNSNSNTASQPSASTFPFVYPTWTYNNSF